MPNMKHAKLGAGLAMSAIVLTGCFYADVTPAGEPVDLTESDVVGTWLDRHTGEAIVFQAEGTFEADNLPYQMFSGFSNALPSDIDPERDKLPAIGEWRLGPLGQPANEPRYTLILLPEKVAGHTDSGAYELRPERFNGVLVISYYVGDPDQRNRVMYERCRETCATLPPDNRG